MLLNTAPLLPSVGLVVMARNFLASCLLWECHLFALEGNVSESGSDFFFFKVVLTYEYRTNTSMGIKFCFKH